MSFQIFNDGAVIRIENGQKTLLVTKEQVKTIDTIHDSVVRIDIGEGPLKNIFVNYADVTAPVVASASELRDLIKGWMLSDNYSGGDATEETQLTILSRLGEIALILQDIKLQEKDIAKADPSRLDESNPYMIYRGWHSVTGVAENPEWAIERVRRDGDEIIREWAYGSQQAIYPWNTRDRLEYSPLIFGSAEKKAVPDLNPPSEGPDPSVNNQTTSVE